MTLFVMALPNLLPPKTLDIMASPDRYGEIFDDSEAGGSSHIQWIDFNLPSWRCDIAQVLVDTYCGFNLYWSVAPFTSTDFSQFDALSISLDYQGPANRIRIYLRNRSRNAVISTQLGDHKFNYVTIRTEDISQPLILSMSEFRVAEWWLEQYNIARPDSFAELNSVVSLGIDLGAPQMEGKHEFALNELKLVGKWIEPETLYLAILSCWIVIVIGVVLFRLVLLNQQSSRQLQWLRDAEVEKTKLEKMSFTDPLTQVLNRAGLDDKITAILAQQTSLQGYMVMVMDIDFFKQINDTFGHDVGDKVLQELAALISSKLRNNDILCRWGGEEFVVLALDTGPNRCLAFANKLCTIVGNSHFSHDDHLPLTISIGMARFEDNESFEQGFKRADNALYLAKSEGRNCCRMAPVGLVQED
ncbi:GGDEF domain-containing protein [Alteromonadaceae bacterium BrNp21-10]|nr:GGDEF domain-containing protein [Alteromonadaceae bacterium BrNp21-10]